MTAARPLLGGYAALAIVGAVLPLGVFVPWLGAHGLDARRFVADLFANRVSAFFGCDVIVSALALTLFVAVQGARDGVRGRWLAVAATFLIGVSCGLPLFLALRERALARRA